MNEKKGRKWKITYIPKFASLGGLSQLLLQLSKFDCVLVQIVMQLLVLFVLAIEVRFIARSLFSVRYRRVLVDVIGRVARRRTRWSGRHAAILTPGSAVWTRIRSRTQWPIAVRRSLHQRAVMMWMQMGGRRVRMMVMVAVTASGVKQSVVIVAARCGTIAVVDVAKCWTRAQSTIQWCRSTITGRNNGCVMIAGQIRCCAAKR